MGRDWIPGLLDVDTSVSINSPELQVQIDRRRASDLGVRAADVGNALRLMIAGEDEAAVGEEVRRTGLPAGYAFRFTGAVKILDETTRNLIIAFLLASMFMYMVLAAQFDSFLHPFTIMLSLPLSVPFALFSLWATGRTLNLWSSLGVLRDRGGIDPALGGWR